MKYDVVIIGAGPCGIMLAQYCKKEKLSYIVIENSDKIGGQLISLYPEKTISNVKGYKPMLAKDFIKLISKGINKNKFLLENKITSLSNKKDVIQLKTNKEVIEGKNIIICCGAGVFLFNKPDIVIPKKYSNRIFFQINNTDFLKNKNVIVFGGGDSAIDWANQIQKIAKTTTIVHRRDVFRSSQKVNNKIIKKMNCVITKIQDKYITISNNEKLPYDYLIFQLGIKTTLNNFSWIKNIKKNENNKIIVDNNFATNIKNIYAIGDACAYEGKEYNITSCFFEAKKIIKFLVR